MVTVLYLITVSVWYDLSIFEGSFQVSHCRAEKARLEASFEVNAVCMSHSDRFLIVDKQIYIGDEHGLPAHPQEKEEEEEAAT